MSTSLSEFLAEVGLDEYEETFRSKGYNSKEELLRMDSAEVPGLVEKSVKARKLLDLLAGRELPAFARREDSDQALSSTPISPPRPDRNSRPSSSLKARPPPRSPRATTSTRSSSGSSDLSSSGSTSVGASGGTSSVGASDGTSSGGNSTGVMIGGTSGGTSGGGRGLEETVLAAWVTACAGCGDEPRGTARRGVAACRAVCDALDKAVVAGRAHGGGGAGGGGGARPSPLAPRDALALAARLPPGPAVGLVRRLVVLGCVRAYFLEDGAKPLDADDDALNPRFWAALEDEAGATAPPSTPPSSLPQTPPVWRSASGWGSGDDSEPSSGGGGEVVRSAASSQRRWAQVLSFRTPSFSTPLSASTPATASPPPAPPLPRPAPVGALLAVVLAGGGSVVALDALVGRVVALAGEVEAHITALRGAADAAAVAEVAELRNRPRHRRRPQYRAHAHGFISPGGKSAVTGGGGVKEEEENVGGGEDEETEAAAEAAAASRARALEPGRRGANAHLVAAVAAWESCVRLGFAGALALGRARAAEAALRGCSPCLLIGSVGVDVGGGGQETGEDDGEDDGEDGDSLEAVAAAGLAECLASAAGLVARAEALAEGLRRLQDEVTAHANGRTRGQGTALVYLHVRRGEGRGGAVRSRLSVLWRSPSRCFCVSPTRLSRATSPLRSSLVRTRGIQFHSGAISLQVQLSATHAFAALADGPLAAMLRLLPLPASGNSGDGDDGDDEEQRRGDGDGAGAAAGDLLAAAARHRLVVPLGAKQGSRIRVSLSLDGGPPRIYTLTVPKGAVPGETVLALPPTADKTCRG